MLILTRRVGESIQIGDEITVTVLGVKGNQVRVGVDAPREVAVHREEVAERIRAESPAPPPPAPPPLRYQTAYGRPLAPPKDGAA